MGPADPALRIVRNHHLRLQPGAPHVVARDGGGLQREVRSMIAAAAVRLSEGELDRLRKVSRRAMLLSALGAVIVMAALLIASYQLSQVEAQQKQASTALAQTRAQLEETRTGLARAQ